MTHLESTTRVGGPLPGRVPGVSNGRQQLERSRFDVEPVAEIEPEPAAVSERTVVPERTVVAERIVAPEPIAVEPETVVTEEVPEPAPDVTPKTAPQQTQTKDKRGRPALPSWDDVLLGVRSSGR